ncbi:glycosyltransferase family 2 protein [Butyrivibrio sp. LC3010]|uniref:glycosyltransferase family 2 protein n=1 Tax=Butyrivibrio sp. LC3010 TaxID=1280680 RepID=UPI0003FF291E|nr:glycosyltransferase family 2 protein [Butyrivibrio sp. LC3010]
MYTGERVTIIIPNYNGAKYLDACLRSLKKQTVTSKVIVVDNGSTDNGLEILKNAMAKHAKAYPEVIIHELSENTGFANAVNVGMKLAKTEYVLLLNNDTVSDEAMTEKLIKTADHDKKIFSVQAKMLQLNNPDYIDDAGDYYCALGWAFSPARDKHKGRYNKKKTITSACAGAAIYRKSVFEEIGYFDEAHFCYLEDVDIGYRARIFGYKNVFEPSAIVYHAGSGTSGSRYNVFKEELTAANNLYFIYKNMPFLQIIINLPLIVTGIIIKQLYFSKKKLGRAYFKGLMSGINKIIHNSNKKVAYSNTHFKNYAKLELELLVNCVRRLVG